MSVFAQMWLLTRIFRFRLAKEFPPVAGELSGAVWLLLYGIAIGLIFLLPLIGAVLLAASFLHVAGVDLQAMMSNPWVIAGLIGAMIGFLVALLYVSTRFSVAFPAVAMGGRPGIFHTMWPLGRDVTWALLGWSILLGLGIGTIMGIFMLIGIAAFLPVLMSAETPADIATVVENHFGWAVAMFTLIQAPGLLYYVASSTVFAEAYAQLSQRKPEIAE